MAPAKMNEVSSVFIYIYIKEKNCRNLLENSFFRSFFGEFIFRLQYLFLQVTRSPMEEIFRSTLNVFESFSRELDPVLSAGARLLSLSISCMWLFCRVGSVRFCSFSHRFTSSPLVVLRSVMDKASLFQSIGLSEQKAQETLKNEALSTRLESIINLVRMYNGQFQSMLLDLFLR